jgi:hypothetical protein
VAPSSSGYLALILVGAMSLVWDSVGFAAEAQADKAACIDAHTKGQELRLGGKWVAATKLFRSCSAGSCPTAVTQDCTRWYDELHASTPSILMAVTGPDGTDTVDVKLVIDGAKIADRLPPTSVDLDPGEHTIRVEHPGWPPTQEKIVLREREKDRRVALRFAQSSASADGKPSAAKDTGGSPTFGLVMLGIGGALLGTGVTFGVLGKVREDDLAGSPCGKDGTCATDDVDVVRQRYLIGGVAGGAGLVALAIGIYALLSRPSPARTGWIRAFAGAEGRTTRCD